MSPFLHAQAESAPGGNGHTDPRIQIYVHGDCRICSEAKIPTQWGGNHGAAYDQINPSEETIQIGPLGIRFLLTGEDTNGSMSVFEVLVPAGQKLPAPAHKNDAYEEILYGIEGVLTWTVDGTPIEVGPGQALCIPRGAVHRFDNLGSEDVKQLAVISPCDHGPRVLPRSGRSNRCRRRRPARPREDDGRLPASWHDDGRAPACISSGRLHVSWLIRNLGLDEFRQQGERLLPAEIARLGRNDIGNPFLRDVQLGPAGHLLQA